MSTIQVACNDLHCNVRLVLIEWRTSSHLVNVNITLKVV